MDQSNPENYLEQERQYFGSIAEYFSGCDGSYNEKMHAFPRFVHRQAISYFLARNEIFKEIVPLHGSIMDFGVFRGSSFFTWLQLSATYEPYNHIRKIIGFDSFEGFSNIDDNDRGSEGNNLHIKGKGGMTFKNGMEEILRGIELYDQNRPLGHVSKGQVIEGALPFRQISARE